MRPVEPVHDDLGPVRNWCGVAAAAAWSKGGRDTLVLSVGPVLAITDAFVITSATNPRAVRTITEEVEEKVRLAGGPSPIRIEGLDDARWVLMDYGDFVVHVMLDEARDFYELERLWSDAETWPWRGEEDRAGISGA
ncbi:MAG: ribosome silencing factor [Acidimicrobiales bacterium]